MAQTKALVIQLRAFFSTVKPRLVPGWEKDAAAILLDVLADQRNVHFDKTWKALFSLIASSDTPAHFIFQTMTSRDSDILAARKRLDARLEAWAPAVSRNKAA